MLPCGHTICVSDLSSLLSVGSTTPSGALCPECRQPLIRPAPPTPPPDQGISLEGFPVNVSLLRLVDKQTQSSSAVSLQDAQPSEPKCTVPGHSGEQLSLYCHQCRASLCPRCLSLPQHASHLSALTSLSEYESALSRQAEELAAGPATMTSSVQLNDGGSSSSQQQNPRTVDGQLQFELLPIHQHTQMLQDTLIEAVRARCDQLRSEAEKKMQAVRDKNAEQQARLQKLQEDSSRLSASMRDALRKENIDLASRLGEQVESLKKEMASAETDSISLVKQIPHLQFHDDASATEGTLQMIAKLGAITIDTSQSVASPSSASPAAPTPASPASKPKATKSPRDAAKSKVTKSKDASAARS